MSIFTAQDAYAAPAQKSLSFSFSPGKEKLLTIDLDLSLQLQPQCAFVSLQASAPVAPKAYFLYLSSVEVLWVATGCPNPKWQLVGGTEVSLFLSGTSELICSHDKASQLLCLILTVMAFLLPSSRTPIALFYI